jgi:2'-hydroxyisoflavone reductase
LPLGVFLITSGFETVIQWNSWPKRIKLDLQESLIMKLLILGGTKFVGPHLIRAAQKNDHEVTTFTRGKQSAETLPGVEAIYGDRNADLAKLSGRRWDAVIDTSGYLPQQVKTSAGMLSRVIDLYVYISSISAYADFSQMGITEDAPVHNLTRPQQAKANAVDTSGPVSAVSFGEMYGGLKALCEQAAEEEMPGGRTLVIRPGLIVGPGDNTDRFTYWPVRVSRGGEMIAPGRTTRELQFIDVRDLAEWTIHMIEQGKSGTYNANGLPASTTMAELLDESKRISGSDATFSWIADEFLIEQGVTPWSELPLWVPEYDSQDSRGFMFVNVRKAVGDGLKFTPLAETIKDTLDWFKTDRFEPERKAGLSPEKEAVILRSWADQVREG